MKTQSKTTAVGLLCFFLFASAGANATPLNPNDFSSLGTFFGDIDIDTSLLTANGSTGVSFSQGGLGPDIAVFTFADGSSLGNVTVTGDRAVAILFQGSGTINGAIRVDGGNGFDSLVGGLDHGGAGFGVASGAQGGRGGPFQSGINPATGKPYGAGDGSGGGVLASSSASTSGAGSGSGGGFGTEGGSGGAGTTFRPGGLAYGGDQSDVLLAGSGGAGGGGHCCGGLFGRGGGGGAGGGAIEIGAVNNLNLIDALITADGGDGGDGTRGGGGGSGGGILLHAFNIHIDAGTLISANGGNGGSPDSAAGGCGGAGRISLLHNSAGNLTNEGSVSAVAGTGNSTCSANNIVSFASASDIGSPPASVPEPPIALLLMLGLIAMARTNRIA